MSGDTVVLPDGDTWPPVNAVDCEGGVTNRNHDIFCLGVGEIKERRNVLIWKDKKVSNAPLLPCDENRYSFFPPQHGVRPDSV